MPVVLGAIGAGLAALGGGSAAAGAGIATGILSSAVGAGTSIAGAVKKPPEANVVPPPDPIKAEEAKAQERRRAGQRQGFRSTILSQALKEYSPTGGKQTFGE